MKFTGVVSDRKHTESIEISGKKNIYAEVSGENISCRLVINKNSKGQDVIRITKSGGTSGTMNRVLIAEVVDKSHGKV